MKLKTVATSAFPNASDGYAAPVNKLTGATREKKGSTTNVVPESSSISREPEPYPDFLPTLEQQSDEDD